jgi:hypothetical protein
MIKPKILVTGATGRTGRVVYPRNRAGSVINLGGGG